MSNLVGLAVVGFVFLVAFLATLALLGTTVTKLRTLGAVADRATPLDDLDGGGRVHAVAEYRGTGDGYLLEVVDRFGYWLLRSAQNSRSDVLVRWLVERLYGVSDIEDGLRRRAAVAAPEPLSLSAGGQRYALRLGEDAVPLERFEADGGLLPFVVLLFVGLPTVLVGLLSPVLLFLGSYSAVVLGALAVLWAPVVAAKVYHDRPLLGWDATAASLDAAPAPVRSAVSVAVDGLPRLVFHRRLAPGETVQVVGRVERDGDELTLVDGFVTTRGNWFARLATTVGLVRSVVYLLIAAAIALGTGALLYVDLVGPLPVSLPPVG